MCSFTVERADEKMIKLMAQTSTNVVQTISTNLEQMGSSTNEKNDSKTRTST